MFVALLALVGQANAQRCLPKMKGIELKANMADGFHTSDKDNSAGCSFGAEYMQWHSPYKDIRIPVSQFTAEGGYYYKFLSDARKIVFFYIGASALAGYEMVNWGDKLLFDGATLHARDRFVYGGAVTLDMEIYIADRIALLANIRERCLWGGDTKKFHTQYGLGIKFIIN